MLISLVIQYTFFWNSVSGTEDKKGNKRPLPLGHNLRQEQSILRVV